MRRPRQSAYCHHAIPKASHFIRLFKVWSLMLTSRSELLGRMCDKFELRLNMQSSCLTISFPQTRDKCPAHSISARLCISRAILHAHYICCLPGLTAAPRRGQAELPGVDGRTTRNLGGQGSPSSESCRSSCTCSNGTAVQPLAVCRKTQQQGGKRQAASHQSFGNECQQDSLLGFTHRSESRSKSMSWEGGEGIRCQDDLY